MNLDLLADPLFRLPFLTGLLLAAMLPLVGMYLRLRDEWLAALAFTQVASAGALVAEAFAFPLIGGGLGGAMLAALLKGRLERAGASGYALIMLGGWAVAVLLAANLPLADRLTHALFDGQLYFTGPVHLAAAAAACLFVLPVLRTLSRPLLLERFFPDFFRARGLSAARYHLAFDLLAALVLALATTSIGIMAAFALVFAPPLAAFRFGSSWRKGLAAAVATGVGAYILAFALALALDQPFGPLCAIVLVLSAGAVALSGRR